MTNTHTAILTSGEVQRIARPIVEGKLSKFGFRDVTVKAEEDFDGETVLRVTVHVDDRVPATKLLDALDDLNQALSEVGDERFVYLSTKRPGEEEIEEDIG